LLILTKALFHNKGSEIYKKKGRNNKYVMGENSALSIKPKKSKKIKE